MILKLWKEWKFALFVVMYFNIKINVNTWIMQHRVRWKENFATFIISILCLTCFHSARCLHTYILAAVRKLHCSNSVVQQHS